VCRNAGRFQATPRQLAAVLATLTSLQQLDLRGFELLSEYQQQPQDADLNVVGTVPQSDTVAAASTQLQLEQALHHHQQQQQSICSLEDDTQSIPQRCSSDVSHDRSTSSGSACARSASSESGAVHMLSAIAGLPHLHRLSFGAVHSRAGSESSSVPTLLPIDEQAASMLAAATQLTNLSLRDCGLHDDAVNTLAASLTQLQRLRLDRNPGVTGDVLPGIVAGRLERLRDLCVFRTGIIRQGSAEFQSRLEECRPGLRVHSKGGPGGSGGSGAH
jgi:hypothetical protein